MLLLKAFEYSRMKTLLVIIFLGMNAILSAQKQPNVVLIIADDISADFSCYGGQVKTPHIDQLAADGVRFNNAYVTASSCSPSRNSIITGRYPHNTGAPELHMHLPEGQVMFPKLLKDAGYYCAQYGKWHMGDYARQAFGMVQAVHYPDDPTGAKGWVPLLQNVPEKEGRSSCGLPPLMPTDPGSPTNWNPRTIRLCSSCRREFRTHR